MTVSADSSRKSSLSSNIMNQLDYGCPYYQEPNGTAAADCRDKTSLAREIARPLTSSLIGTMFKQYLDIVNVSEARSTDSNIRKYVCGLTYTSLEEFRRLLNPLVELLSVPNDASRGQKLKTYQQYLAEDFKTSGTEFDSKMREMLEGSAPVNVTVKDCKTSYYDEKLSQEAKATMLLTYKVITDNTRMSFGNWHSMVQNGDFDTDVKAQDAFWDNFKELEKQVAKSMENLIQEDGIALRDVMTFLGLSDENLGHKAGVKKKAHQVDATKSYEEILRVAKYSIRPLHVDMTEQARVEDMQDKSLTAFNASIGRAEPGSFINFNPTLLHCSLGKKKSQTCQHAVTTFTTTGLGYSFNTEGFFQMYKRSPRMETFCDQMVEQVGQDLCSQDNANVTKKVAMIKTNGPGFALRLVLNLPEKKNLYEKDPPLRLAIHSPYSIADMSGNSIEPRAGMHTTVVVTPHLTDTDESLLSGDASVRACHSPEHDINPLKIHQSYTKENCVFECHLQRSIDRCGCVPWNYPKLDPQDETCSAKEALCVYEAMEEAADMDICPHCQDACKKEDYEFATDTKPLKDICDEKASIRSAVWKVVNNFNGNDNFLPYHELGPDVNIKEHLQDVCSPYSRVNVAVVDMYIGPPVAVQIMRTPRVTTLQLIANLGKY